jgi:hypothetical protein
MKITGKITEILPKESGTSKAGKQWVKQTVVIDSNEQYNNIYPIEVFGDEKVENLNKYNKVGDTVDVEFNISANKWKDKYFTSLQAWKITKANVTETALKQATESIDAVFEPLDGASLAITKDDLPF